MTILDCTGFVKTCQREMYLLLLDVKTDISNSPPLYDVVAV